MDQATSQRFKYWQTRTIIATMIGYALFYFVRKNLSIAMPAMQADLDKQIAYATDTLNEVEATLTEINSAYQEDNQDSKDNQ